MERKQFTFYGSFYKAMSKITNKVMRADIFDTICTYALFEQSPDEDALHPAVFAIFQMAKPTLDSARKKAIAGSEGGKKQAANKREANSKQTASEGEKEIEKENENEIENEIEKENELERESENARVRFERFWDAYPKKVDKQRAWEAFSGVDEKPEVLLAALERQKRSSQWLEDGGRFVPRAAQWLREKRWQDPLPQAQSQSLRPSGVLGEAELAAIAQMLAES